MTRIIGGTAGGRRITAPSGHHTRPTTDRVREALFSAIESWCGSLQGLRFLDLYAGSGAVGLEAWSRGAGVVTLVESDRRTARLIGDNARVLGFGKAGRRVRARVPPRSATATERAVRRGLPRPAVPPRRGPPSALTSTSCTQRAGWCRARWSWSSARRAARSRRGPTGIDGRRSKRYGETVLWYGHAAATAQEESLSA